MADSAIQRYGDYIDKAKEYINTYNPNETVNYNDSRLTNIKNEEKQKENQTENNYNEMINNSNTFYEQQIQNSKEWAEKQQQIQQENTDFAIEKINQEKEKSEKDYTKEQKGSYVDYQKASSNYGINAEQMALTGLNNAGYSETTKASMFNTYQNRVAIAREGFNQAVQNYNNSIKEAQLANNSTLAEISYKSLQEQLELSLQGFQYKNSLLQAKQEQLNVINTRYDNKYQNVLSQINQEISNRQNLYNTYSGAVQDYNKLLENTRQFNEEMGLKRQQFNEEMAYQREQDRRDEERWKKEYELSKAKTYNSLSNQLSVTDTNNSTKYNNYSNMVTQVKKDIDSIYKDYSGNFKDSAINIVVDKLNTGYNSGEISKEELKELLNKLNVQ